MLFNREMLWDYAFQLLFSWINNSIALQDMLNLALEKHLMDGVVC